MFSTVLKHIDLINLGRRYRQNDGRRGAGTLQSNVRKGTRDWNLQATWTARNPENKVFLELLGFFEKRKYSLREQIKRKLELAASKKKKKGGGEESTSGSKKKKRKISEGSDEREEGEIAEKNATNEEGDASDDDDDEKDEG